MTPRPFTAWPCRFVVAFTTIVLPACTHAPHVPAPTSAATAGPAPSIADREWRCIRLGDVATPADGMPTFTLSADGKANGFAGVNRWFGTCTATGSALTFGRLASTRMAGPPARMELEQQYLRAMATVTHWTIADGKLRLSDGTSVVAEFEPIPAAPDAKH